MSTRLSSISIIIPAYNEENRLPHTLDQVMTYLEHQAYRSEVLVVENGSTDGTVAVVRDFMARWPAIRLIRSAERGKGRAVKLGMLAARGDYCFLCDADLSMPIVELARFLPPMCAGYDIAIGSREMPGARRLGEPAHRHWMTRVYAFLVRLLALPNYADTQCGFKMFRRDVIRPLFRQQTMSGWGFDVELLYIARKLGYRVAEVPIDWYYNADSRVRPIHDAFQMIRDLLRIRWNDLRGRYRVTPEQSSFRRAAEPTVEFRAR